MSTAADPQEREIEVLDRIVTFRGLHVLDVTRTPSRDWALCEAGVVLPLESVQRRYVVVVQRR